MIPSYSIITLLLGLKMANNNLPAFFSSATLISLRTFELVT